jgi:hypothetical protein
MMGIVLHTNLGPLARLCADEGASRFACSGVRVLDQNGAYRLEATDGRRLAIVRGEYPVADGPSPNRDFIVPAREWQEALAALKKATDRGRHTIPAFLSADKHDYTFRTVGWQKQGVLAEGRWPNTDGALPRKPPVWVARFNPKYLASLCDLAAALGCEGVDLLVYAGDGPVGLCGKNDQGQYLDALVMPLT